MNEIKVYDPRTDQIFVENVYGGTFLRAAYSNPTLKRVIGKTSFQKTLSRFVGVSKTSSISRAQIQPFIKKYGINMDDFEIPEGGFKSFNEFFVRKKKTIQFPEDHRVLGSPCDARLSISRIENGNATVQVKGQTIELPNFLGPLQKECPQKGWALTFRLCPVDYHRFHFVDSGTCDPTLKLGTKLHSVNPWALEQMPKLFEWNERQVTLQHGDTFGPIIYAEVGALCVGRIHQTYSPDSKVARGQEKGFFDFGASTLVLIFGENVQPEPKLLAQNKKGLEVLTRIGDNVATLQ